MKKHITFLAIVILLVGSIFLVTTEGQQEGQPKSRKIKPLVTMMNQNGTHHVGSVYTITVEGKKYLVVLNYDGGVNTIPIGGVDF